MSHVCVNFHSTFHCQVFATYYPVIFLTAFNLINYFDEKLFHEFSMQRSSFSFLINENFILSVKKR